jgi:hypothetical protein
MKLTATVNLTPCPRCQGTPRIGAHGTGHATLTRSEAMELASRLYSASRKLDKLISFLVLDVPGHNATEAGMQLSEFSLDCFWTGSAVLDFNEV